MQVFAADVSIADDVVFLLRGRGPMMNIGAVDRVAMATSVVLVR